MKLMAVMICLLAAALPALAEKTTVSLLDLGGGGDVRDAEVVAITDSLAVALDKAGTFDVIAPGHRDQLLSQRGFWSEGVKNLPDRLTVAGRCLGADRMIGGQLERTGAGFNLSLQLVDVATGAVVSQFRQERLDKIGDVFNALTDAVRQFLGAVPAPLADSLKGRTLRGSCRIVSKPSGANVYIEGLARGVTPLQVDSLPAGPHQVFLDLDRYRRGYSMIRVRKGGIDSAMVVLEPKKASDRERVAPGNPQANQPDTAPVAVANHQPNNPAPVTDSVPDKNMRMPGVKNPKPLKMVQPVYPALAKQAGIGGLVRVQMLVDITGHVSRVDVETSSGNQSLDDAAVAAAKQWLFAPAVGNDDKPVRVWVSHPFTFKWHQN